MHRRQIRTWLFSVLFFSALSVTAFAEQAIVTGEEVNVRSGPGLVYSNFTSLREGMTVEVLNRSNADWYQVSWDGNVGYVSSAYLRLAEDTAPAGYDAAGQSSPGYINAMYVSLRSGPGTGYSVLGTYSNGKELTIRGSSGEWTAVTVDGKDGFVYHDYVSAGSVSAALIEPADSSLGDPYGGIPISGQQNVTTVIGNSIGTGDVKVPEQGANLTESSAVGAVGTASGELPVMPGTAEAAASSESSAGSSVTATLGVGTVSQDAAVPAESRDRTGEISGSLVRFRTGPGTTYPIIGTYNRGTALQITGFTQGWTQAVIDGVSGYVFTEYVKENPVSEPQREAALSEQPGAAAGGQASAVFGQAANDPGQEGQGNAADAVSQTLGLNESLPAAVAPTDGYISGNGVRLRQAPSMTAGILSENLNTGNNARILGASGDWTHVIVNGQEGFVWSAYVKEGRYEPAGSVRRAAGSDLGKEIADYALSFLGTRYTWGGKSPATGFDCSGFVQYVFSQFGYTTSSIANDVRDQGVHVDPSDIQPGDVLCFYSGNNYVGHVGIYIGDNTFVHAANSDIGVVTTSLSVGYYAQRGYEIRRMT